MVEAFGGWATVDGDDARPGRAAPTPADVEGAPSRDEEDTKILPLSVSDQPPSVMPSAVPGTVLLDRYLLGRPVGVAEQHMFLADDRATRGPVTVQLVSADGDPLSLMASLRLGRSVGHRSLLRVHDVASAPWGALVVMDAVGEHTLANLIELHRATGGVTADVIRRVGDGVAAALAAIHAQGLVHGRLEPAMVLLVDGAPRLLSSLLSSPDLPAAPSRRAGSRSPFHSPERDRGGPPSAADDLYALGMVLWALAAKLAPTPGLDPRALSLRSDAFHNEVSRLTSDELRQMHHAVSPDPSERPAARTIRFFDSRHSSPTLLQSRGDHLHPGPPPTVSEQEAFPTKAMSLLITYAATEPELAGELLPLRKQTLALGRDANADVSTPDQTVSTEHALLVWRKGTWIINDCRSTNGTYADGSYARQDDMRLRHGGEVQFGELRAMLVSFERGSALHLAARAYLARRDGLTRLMHVGVFFDALRKERQFADWADLQLHLAIFEIRLQKPSGRPRLTVLELLVLRRLARRVTELTDSLMVHLRTATAGLVPVPRPDARKAPLVAPRVVISWIGVNAAQARVLLDTMLAELKALMPPGLQLRATLVPCPAGANPAALIDEA